MKVLVIGKGGREHSLVWRLHQSESVWKIFCATGNPGINQIAEAVPIPPTETSALIEFAKSKEVDLTVVGPEDPLATGIVDEFTRAGLKIFGPSAAAAQLETSKSFAKTIMREAGVPTADFESFDDADAARSYVRSRKRPLVVKADGLALGKGVVICHEESVALQAIADAMETRRFGTAGNRVVIEEFLGGEELSFFALCDGENAIPLGSAQDHKAIFDDDRGPNTGGMGAYTPVPQFGADFDARIMHEVVAPTLRAMNARGTPFRGVLFAGLMIDGDKINVIEFNVRFGDPECEPLMMRFDGDLGETLLAAADGNLAKASSFRLSPRSAVAVVMSSGGYPADYAKGIEIFDLDRIEGNAPSEIKTKWAINKIRVKVFHNGTAMRDGHLVTDGGRVLTVTAMAPKLAAAVDAAYQAAEMIRFEGRHFRRDIGRRALARISGSGDSFV
jgi:phosphoribosylamine---glycine ligase